MEYDRNKLLYHDQPEDIWVVQQSGSGILGAATTEEGTSAIVARQGSLTQPYHVEKVTLHRPSLRPVYGGPTLLEALWNEMDALMERLMTGAVNEDGGDRFRAEELAWVIAIVTNAYAPSMDQVRAEAMRRWNEGDPQAQEEFDRDVRTT